MKKRGIKFFVMQPGADRAEIIEKTDEMGIVYQRGCMILEPLVRIDEKERIGMEEEKEKNGVDDSDCACSIL